MADHVELKHLNRRIEESRAALRAMTEDKKDLEQRKKDLEQRIGTERDKITRLQAEIERLKKSSERLVVSEHAILRYIERVMGLDLEEIKKKILPDDVESRVRVIGSGTFPAGTHRVKVQNGVVITILTDDE